MGVRRDFMSVEIGDQVFDRWTQYTVGSDLLTPADVFNMRILLPKDTALHERARELTKPGATAKLYLVREVDGTEQRALQMTGTVEGRSIRMDRKGGTTLNIDGRDLAGSLVDANVPPGLVREDPTRTYAALVRAAVEPFGITVVTDDSAERSILTGERRRRRRGRLERREAQAAGVSASSYSRRQRDRAAASGTPLDEVASGGNASRARRRFANRMTGSDVERIRLDQAKPNIGETVWDFLSRHARRLGLLMWMTPDGKLVVSSPDYDQEPLYRLVRRRVPEAGDPNTIMAGGLKESIQNRYSSVTVYGRSGGRDASRSRFTATATDADWPNPNRLKPRFLHDNRSRTTAQCQRRADKELSKGKRDRFQLDYTVDGHGQGDVLWAQHTIADVDDEVTGARDRYFIQGRTFSTERAGGTTTELVLIERGSIEL